MYKDVYKVKCVKNINHNVLVETVVPGSKSITNRALLIAAMANGTSILKGCLTSEDAKYFVSCLKTLGFPVKETFNKNNLNSNISITGFGGEIPNKRAEIYVGSAGTAARFLVAMLAFSDGEYIVNSSEQMKKRPMKPLVMALRNAGATVECMEKEGHFPFHIVGIKTKSSIPESFEVNIDESSQFLSALMIAVGTLGKKSEINVVGSHGLSYVDLTAKMINSFGVIVDKQTTSNGQIKYIFSGKEKYLAIEYDIEPDMSAAAYFYALAGLLGVQVSVKGVNDNMLQGDTKFLDVLQKMDCQIKTLKDGTISIIGAKDGNLKGGFTVDMSEFSDQALTLAAIAPYANSPITITGIGHIRLQECDRIKAIVNNLTLLGIKVEEGEDNVKIYNGIPKGGKVETYDDHRVAMSFALMGLRTENIEILNPNCCKKTFKEYFNVLENVISQIEF